MSSTYSTVETAKAMRKALRRRFPGTKISARMANGTAYGWIDVAWTDGPTDRQVRDVVAGFESERFSGMDDAYHQVPGCEWNCCGALTSRRHSPEAEAWATRVLASGTDAARHLMANAEARFPTDAYYYAVNQLIDAHDLTGHDLTSDTIPATSTDAA